ncbi:MAG: ATP-binding cassette domain-containing protein, partial [Methylobacteriaceae bacterium]|nr:ATP-binding cassette domain-containing protein [Methylobacteriaceae bacterium]
NRYLEPLDLSMRKGQVVGVVGLLGSGRTETAKLVFGIVPADKGKAYINGQYVSIRSPRDAIAQGFGYCPEDRKTEGIVGDLSVRENIILALQAKRGWFRPIPRAEQQKLADKYIQLLDIRPADSERPIQLLSGGNQQKALLARWLATEPQYLILDEPTRGIDVGAHAEIINLIDVLCSDGVSLLVISSELEEIVTYSHSVMVMRDHRKVTELVGEDINVNMILKTIAGTLEKEEVAA